MAIRTGYLKKGGCRSRALKCIRYVSQAPERYLSQTLTMDLAGHQVSHGVITPPETTPKEDDYVTRAARKVAQQTAKIPKDWRLGVIPSVDDAPDAREYIRTCGLLTAGELEWTETTDMTNILQKLATRQISSVELVRAFSKRAAIAHQLTNCCTEIFFDEALEEANKLDDILAQTGKPVGPLHGLPISVKDSIGVKGHDTSIGELHQPFDL